MKEENDNERRIYLYSHSPEAEKAVQSGDAKHSTGGVRRNDGTMLDMVKPLSFTLDELKEMIRIENHPESSEENGKIQTEVALSQQSVAGLSRIGWLNNAALSQINALTTEGFQNTLMRLQYLSTQIDSLYGYLQQKDLEDYRQNTDSITSNLEVIFQSLVIDDFSESRAKAEATIPEMYSFIKRVYDGLFSGSIDGFFAWSIIMAVIEPFAAVVSKYAILFYFEKGLFPPAARRWIDLIKLITSDSRFHEKTRYFVRLKSKKPFVQIVREANQYNIRLTQLQDGMEYVRNYALTHSKEEYLNLPKSFRDTIAHLLSSPDSIPDDGIIYL